VSELEHRAAVDDAIRHLGGREYVLRDASRVLLGYADLTFAGGERRPGATLPAGVVEALVRAEAHVGAARSSVNGLDSILDAHRRERRRSENAFDLVVIVVAYLTYLVALCCR
jgi:hypothetical protein